MYLIFEAFPKAMNFLINLSYLKIYKNIIPFIYDFGYQKSAPF